MHTRLALRRSASHQNCLLHKTFKTGPGNTQNTFVLAVPTNGVKTTWLSLAAEKLSLCQGLVTHPSSVTDRGGLEIIYIQHRGGRSIGERLACTKLALVQLLPPNQCACSAPQMAMLVLCSPSQLPIHPVSISHPTTRVSRS